MQLWRRPGSSHPEVAQQSAATWPVDRKFRGPDKHFAEDRANPVPLAIVICELRRLKLRCGVAGRCGRWWRASMSLSTWPFRSPTVSMIGRPTRHVPPSFF